MSHTKFIDHVAIAVHSIETHLPIYKDLGFRLDRIENVEEQKVRVAFLSLSRGETRIELVEPLGPDSPIQGFLKKYGEKIHHVCLRTSDIVTDMATLANKGYQWLREKPTQGAGKACVAFLHPHSTGGVLFEFKEK